MVPTDYIIRVITFPEAGEGSYYEDILWSGWVLGEAVISEKVVMEILEHGEGQASRVGFRR